MLLRPPTLQLCAVTVIHKTDLGECNSPALEEGSVFFVAIVEVPCLHDGIYDDCCGVRFELGSGYAVYAFEKDDQLHKPMLGYS